MSTSSHKTWKYIASVVLVVGVYYSMGYLMSLDYLTEASALLTKPLHHIANACPIYMAIFIIVATIALCRDNGLLGLGGGSVVEGNSGSGSQFHLSTLVLAAILAAFAVAGATLSETLSLSVLYVSKLNVISTVISFVTLTFTIYLGLCSLYSRITAHQTIDLTKSYTPLPSTDDTNSTAFNIRDIFNMRYSMPILMLVLIVCWMPYIVTHLPGGTTYDITYQLSQFEGYLPWSTHHPLFSTIIYGAAFTVGQAIGGSSEFGLLAIVIMQTLTLSAAATFTVFTMRKLGAPFTVLVVTTCFFALNPIFALYSLCAVKDSLFAACFLVYVDLFIWHAMNKLANTRNSEQITHGHLIALCVFALLVGLLRNNGVFVVLLSMPFLAILNHGHRAKIKTICIGLLCVILTIALNNIAAFALGAEKGSIREALSIPLQQTARYALLHPDDVQDWEADILNTVLDDYDDLATEYTPKTSDPTKEKFKNDASLIDYLKVWLSQGLRHPATYLEATALNTFGYWYPLEGNSDALSPEYAYTRTGRSEALHDFGWEPWNSERIMDMADYFSTLEQALPIAGYFMRSGIYTWALIVAAGLMLFNRKGKGCVTLLPCAILLLTIIAGPLNGSIRYALGIIAASPIAFYAAWKIGSGKALALTKHTVNRN